MLDDIYEEVQTVAFIISAMQIIGKGIVFTADRGLCRLYGTHVRSCLSEGFLNHTGPKQTSSAVSQERVLCIALVRACDDTLSLLLHAGLFTIARCEVQGWCLTGDPDKLNEEYKLNGVENGHDDTLSRVTNTAPPLPNSEIREESRISCPTLKHCI